MDANIYTWREWPSLGPNSMLIYPLMSYIPGKTHISKITHFLKMQTIHKSPLANHLEPYRLYADPPWWAILKFPIYYNKNKDIFKKYIFSLDNNP